MDEILNLIESVSEGFPSYFPKSQFFIFIHLNEHAEPSKINEKMSRKKLNFHAVCFPLALLNRKNKKIIFCLFL